jgi:broad specificity phosphatase PhoE
MEIVFMRRDYGRWAGRKFTDVQTEEPASVAAGSPMLKRRLMVVSRSQIYFGASRRGWMSAFEKRHTIAVTHAAAIRAAILYVLDAPARSFWRIDIEPLSVTKLRGDGVRWTLLASEKSRKASLPAV